MQVDETHDVFFYNTVVECSEAQRGEDRLTRRALAALWPERASMRGDICPETWLR